eukprot:m.126537 g.126537  ORF g.126537 m.126537 type:complete len:135 (+) comp17376_c0_seq5:293-697(+)
MNGMISLLLVLVSTSLGLSLDNHEACDDVLRSPGSDSCSTARAFVVFKTHDGNLLHSKKGILSNMQHMWRAIPGHVHILTSGSATDRRASGIDADAITEACCSQNDTDIIADSHWVQNIQTACATVVSVLSCSK